MEINDQIARKLDEVSDLLHEQGANPFRVRAYQRGADTVRRLGRPVTEILEQGGVDELQRLPGIGYRLAIAIRDLIRMGRLAMLDRLRGQADPVELLRTVPGIGNVNADRLHSELGIESLEDLESAALDGRLTNLAGLGKKRVSGILDTLATRLGKLRQQTLPHFDEPSIDELLDVDREYRRLAAAGKLHKIAPRRFNPNHEAWLPILHTSRGERHYTALFSNTARAHELGKTQDWVILYFEAGGPERQATVITSRFGPLKGHRIIRGREEDCLQYYAVERRPQHEGSQEVRDESGSYVDHRFGTGRGTPADGCGAGL